MAARQPLYIAGVLGLLGGALFLYLQFEARRPARDVPLSPEAQNYVHNHYLQLSEVTMKATESYVGQNLVEIEGQIANMGDRPVDVVELYCYFYDAYGQMVFRPRLAIVDAKMGGLKPGQAKPFRLPFDEIPQSWNQKMPQLVIAGLKFQG